MINNNNNITIWNTSLATTVLDMGIILSGCLELKLAEILPIIFLKKSKFGLLKYIIQT